MEPAKTSPLQIRWNIFLLYYRKAKVQGWTKSLKILGKPGRIAFHAGRLLGGRAQGWSNFYIPSSSREEEVKFCCAVSGHSAGLVERTFEELDRDHEFVDTLADTYSRVRADSPIGFNLGRLKVWYVLVRLLKPELVMETGVHDGLSSALILRAMKRNEAGTLVSIDLPSIDLPPGVDGAGWLVPLELRSRWNLQIGDSRKLLPRLVKQYAPIDIFIHDSDHSLDFQRFEYDTVKPNLKHSGLLLTDDAYPELFAELAQQWGANCYLAAGGRLEGQHEAITLGAFRFDQSAARREG